MSLRQVIAVNQFWAGDAGRLLEQAPDDVVAPNCGSGAPCNITRWLVYGKRLPIPQAHAAWGRSASAVLLINNAPQAATVVANLSLAAGLGACGTEGLGCTVRDAAGRADLPNITGGVLAANLAPHASLLAVVTSPHAAPPPPPPPPPPTPTPPTPPAPPGSCRWVPGAGLRGNDIGKARKLATKEACCAACIAEPTCKAACFRPPSHRGPGAAGCHMKAGDVQDPGGPGDADAVVCIPPRQ